MFTNKTHIFSVSVAALLASGLTAPDAMARPSRSTPPPTTNPNAGEWALINLTAADVASANGGSGVKVALLDGLTDCTHTDLSGRCTNNKLSGGSYRFYSNHGTHTAGIIAGKKYGVATSANILNYAVFDDRGWVATGSKLVDSWRSAASQGASIASMSFGCTGTALCFTPAEIQAMADPNLKLLFVKAAGNDGTSLGNESIAVDSSYALAAMARTILVGSVDVNGKISYFSNTPGTGCLMPNGATSCANDLQWQNHFIVAPGESIYATLPGQKYGYMSGTSMATPVVAGVAALLEARWPTLKSTPEKVAQILLTTATDLGTPGVDPVYGYGLLNAGNAFQAQGAVTLQGTNGTVTTLSGTTLTSTRTFRRFANALGPVTVYDMYGRDYALAQTQALNVRTNVLAMRQMLGRHLLGQGGQEDWTEIFFSSRPNPSGFAMFGSPADNPYNMFAMDRTARMGADLPFKGGVAQMRLTGAGNTRLDFAYDATMRPLSFFASTDLMNNAFIANALINLPGRSRLMVYGATTTGALSARSTETPLTLRLTGEGYLPKFALGSDALEQRQTSIGMGYWTQPDAKTVLGVNLSAMSQKGGYYTLTSNMPEFQKPTRMYNLGVAASRMVNGLELTASGEITHLSMATGVTPFSFSPANLVSAELGLRKSAIAFKQGDKRDSLALALVMPPRAISGHVRVDYMTRTADGLGRQAASYAAPLSQMGYEPVRVEAAYSLNAGRSWSMSLTGGANLANTSELGLGEVMASMKFAF